MSRIFFKWDKLEKYEHLIAREGLHCSIKIRWIRTLGQCRHRALAVGCTAPATRERSPTRNSQIQSRNA